MQKKNNNCHKGTQYDNKKFETTQMGIKTGVNTTKKKNYCYSQESIFVDVGRSRNNLRMKITKTDRIHFTILCIITIYFPKILVKTTLN